MIVRPTLASLVAATVFAVALASSSVGRLILIGRDCRWALLSLLTAAALAATVLLARRRLPLVTYALPLFLVTAAYASTAWSIDPSLTARRATAFALLLVAAASLGTLAASDPGLQRAVLTGVAVAAGAVAVSGLVVLAVAYHDAVQAADVQSPARYQGLGGNPDTAAMLLSLGIPIAIWFVVTERRVGVRLLAGVAGALFAGSVVASGSRGALIAALAGSLVVLGTSTRARTRVAVLSAAVAAFAAGVAITQIPAPASRTPHRGHSSPPAAATFSTNAEQALPLSQEIEATNSRRSTSRRLFSSSGRIQAWGGAIHTWERRPVAGYGFGTEDHAFVDRYYSFSSGLPENSYIGALLQLGAIGLALLAAATLWPLRRFAAAPAAAAVLVTGLVLGLTQSYLFSVGNIATVPFWLAWFMLAGAAARPALERRTRARAREPESRTELPHGEARSPA